MTPRERYASIKRNRTPYVAPTPWSDEFEGFKVLTKQQMRAANVRQSFSGGYIQFSPEDYRKRKDKTYYYMTLANGTKVKLVDSHLGVPLGYNGPSKTITDETGLSSIDYVYKAFDGTHKTVKVEGCGHILELEYAVHYQLLKVRFEKGNDVVVYFRVPATVFGELAYLAKNKGVWLDDKGVERHLLGITFWDIVRISGSIHGSRYRFEYLEKNYVSTGTRIGRHGSGDYVTVEVPKLNIKGKTNDKEDIFIPGETTKIRIKKEDLEQSRSDFSTVLNWDIDKLDDYFDTQYNTDLGKVKGKRARDTLKAAYDRYMAGEDTADIIELLAEVEDFDTHFTFKE